MIAARQAEIDLMMRAKTGGVFDSTNHEDALLMRRAARLLKQLRREREPKSWPLTRRV